MNRYFTGPECSVRNLEETKASLVDRIADQIGYLTPSQLSVLRKIMNGYATSETTHVDPINIIAFAIDRIELQPWIGDQ